MKVLRALSDRRAAAHSNQRKSNFSPSRQIKANSEDAFRVIRLG